MSIPYATEFLELKDICKNFGGVTALEHVDFRCRTHSIHAILGENGAGKSTLIKTICGVHKPDGGQILLEGQKIDFSGPQEAIDAGIVCVFQELSLIPDLSVADNICITDPPRRWGMIHQRAQQQKAEKLLSRIGFDDINPITLVKDLPLSRRQMVEIAKALGRNPRLLILDEATSALMNEDVEKIFDVLRKLRDEGLAILYISHRMQEIDVLPDICSVFRDGQKIETFPKGSKTNDQIVQLMIGRKVSRAFPPKPTRPQKSTPVLEAQRLSWNNRLKNLSFELGKGEILGLGGLDGQGQKELLLGLFGVLRGLKGDITIHGHGVHIKSPKSAKSRENGIALIPEDRKTEGLLLPLSIDANIPLASYRKYGQRFIINKQKEAEVVHQMVRKLSIKLSETGLPVSTLSGGNQQKVVLAKWLLTGAPILLLNDPTRGIDVGTKEELCVLLRQLADTGTSILLYSTDYNELIGMCDRVLIMFDGRIVTTLAGEEITDHNIVAGALDLPQRKPAASRN